jgi:hypothetical protein
MWCAVKQPGHPELLGAASILPTSRWPEDLRTWEGVEKILHPPRRELRAKAIRGQPRVSASYSELAYQIRNESAFPGQLQYGKGRTDCLPELPNRSRAHLASELPWEGCFCRYPHEQG